MWHAAHSLKSGSANVGALALAAHCKELEALGRANTLQAADTVFARVEAEYALVEAAVTAVLHDAEKPSGGSPCIPDLDPTIASGTDTLVVSLTDDIALEHDRPYR
jgi:HPt (histidine-containing phosphotransfer) domain-containing protein